MLRRVLLVAVFLLSATQSVVSTPSDAEAINRRLWVATYDGPRHRGDIPVATEVSPTGGPYSSPARVPSLRRVVPTTSPSPTTRLTGPISGRRGSMERRIPVTSSSISLSARMGRVSS